MVYGNTLVNATAKIASLRAELVQEVWLDSIRNACRVREEVSYGKNGGTTSDAPQ